MFRVDDVALLITVGSDHHPFDRLIGWVDDWLDDRKPAQLTATFQYGTAARPRNGEAHEFLPHQDLQDLLAAADLVVTQGGPMGIIEARRYGVKPIVMPRLARLGEVVDDHQVAFCRRLAETGELVLAEDIATLWTALDEAMSNPAALLLEARAEQERVSESVRRFENLTERLPYRWRPWGRRSKG